MAEEILTTSKKALRINLTDDIYGTFAEIGAGQEVARQFFRAGAASGTIASTISAYDMAYSDALYGSRDDRRYVCRERLEKMLQVEFDKVVSILGEQRPEKTRFFAFANTVTTINFKKDNEGHGWIGFRFQLDAEKGPNQVLLHVRLLENDSLLQQRTLGILGVNLMYACYKHWEYPNTFIQSLLDNLGRDQLEINMIHMEGPELGYVDNRLLAVQLVKNKMAPAIMFDRYGEVQEPGDMVYKKNVLAFRGSFRPITYVGIDMIKSSFAIFKKDDDYDRDNTIALCEITLNNLLEDGDFHERDFLARVDILNGMGQNVMVSNFREYFKLVNYLSRFRIMNLRIVIGVLTFIKVLDRKYYTHLKGGILEAFGKLFTQNMKLYVYPALKKDSDELLSSKNLELPEDIELLYKHLVSCKKIIDIKKVNRERMNVFSHQVLEMIQNEQEGWEELVPKYVSDMIIKNELFGYKPID
jgi:hypothetical protein